MKGIWFCFFIWIVPVGFHDAFGQEKYQRPIIVIDPGHGGTDSGATGINGVREKDVVFKIAAEVLRLNREMFGDSLAIYSTRYTDTLISLGNRTKLANALKADVFVSIHCNQAIRNEAQGIEVYIKRGNGKAARLAGSFTAGLNQKLGLKNRGIKYGNFQVLRETGNCPGVLLELGFLSNAEEAEHNDKKSSISAYALLVLETLVKYFYHD
ncbi:N-acetylmuramoyl-L-alanine amidase [Pricia antarctica]|uniref:N-acetylmuramoyl-L-alanine amidase n=1 Tax=Pricia antarctica TaxID=641691 RepID=A0A1G7HI26_9FLAO|nr:N-acetylmuramoyl-L-alanine amidase [Pricia antarctica]SDE99963.1 N-acetylmuramoyl-L-alanine amidase [Pricia antarctica]